ncbi:hypothetical protein L195_g062232, partial [Trifolium pratense]
MGVYFPLCALKEKEAIRNVLVAGVSQTKKNAIGSVVDKPKQTVPEKDVEPGADVTIVQKPVQETAVVKDVGT